MKLENKIVSYLMKYGNTRENDLINYGVKMFGCSLDELKRAIGCMVVKGKVHRLVHDKLDPPEVYVSLMEPLPPDLVRGFIELSSSRRIERETSAILREAASVAEQRIRQKYPDKFGDEFER
jgi:hypothetical protein